MHPAQLLDCKADLVERVITDALFRKFAEGVFSEEFHSDGTISNAAMNGDAMVRNMAMFAKMGEAFRVKEEMSALVQHAASLLDETDTFMADLAPTPYGMVFFERPLPVSDVRGRTLKVHWMIWGRVPVEDQFGRTHQGIAAYWFNDHLVDPDEIASLMFQPGVQKVNGVEYTVSPTHAKFMREHVGRWGIIGCDIFRTSQPVGPAAVITSGEVQARIIAEGDVPSECTNTLRYLHALWMLLGQTVSSRSAEHVGKPAIRRANRAGIPPRVTVIELRRTEGSRSEGESLVDWSHRWLVRGHPRWQPYGSLGADHQHVLGPVEVDAGHSVRACQVSGCDHMLKRIWIAPYVKGPEGKPLRFTDHVYALNR